MPAKVMNIPMVKRTPNLTKTGKYLRIEEGLKPIKGIYQGDDYSSTAQIGLYPEKWTDNKQIIIPQTDSFSFGHYEFNVGPISEVAELFTQDVFRNVLEHFLAPEHRGTILHVLRLSPYWISALAEQEVLLEIKRGKFRNILVLYRLVELCLAAIQALDSSKEERVSRLRNPAGLLLRQRFIYLAQLRLLEDPDRPLSKYVPGYDFLLREAREAFADLLLDEERVLLTFAEVENGGKTWDLDSEVRLLLFEFSRLESNRKNYLKFGDALWSFAQRDLPGLILTDTLLRRWFLAHDDLDEASAGVHALMKTDLSIPKWAAWVLRHANYLSLVGLVLFFASAFILRNLSLRPERLHEWLVAIGIYGGAFIGLIPPFLSVLAIMCSSKRQLVSRQVLYPLALRVPAMGLVGVLAIAGLMDSLVQYTLNAFDRLEPALFIVLGSIAAAFAYILFEVQTRIPVRQKAWLRAFALWFRGIVSTLWLAIITGWLVDPIGIAACDPQHAATSCVTTSYGSVIELHRFVDFLGGRLSFDYVVLMGAIALLVGVFTQIFWEDKAIAGPL